MNLSAFSLMPYLAIALLSLGLYALWEKDKADVAKYDQAQAQVLQDAKDAAVSAKQIAIAETKLEALNASVQPIIQTVMAAPVTKGCGQVVTTAVEGLRSLYDKSPAQAPSHSR